MVLLTVKICQSDVLALLVVRLSNMVLVASLKGKVKYLNRLLSRHISFC